MNILGKKINKHREIENFRVKHQGQRFCVN